MHTIKCTVVGLDWNSAREGNWSFNQALLISYTTKKFPEEAPGYNLFDNYKVNVMTGGKPSTLDLFASRGNESFDRLRPLQYPQTDVFLVTFSVADQVSFSNVRSKYYPEISYFCPGTPFLLVGLETDLREDPKVRDKLLKNKENFVTVEQGERLAKELGAVKYVECSALTRRGLNEVFDEAVAAALEARDIKLQQSLLEAVTAELQPSLLSKITRGVRNVLGNQVQEAETEAAPEEISTKGPKALQAYIQASRYGTRPIYRTRIMLVGQERVGKTSLINSLLGQKYSTYQDITDGVDTTKLCKVPIHKAGTAWQVQRSELTERSKKIKSEYIKAMARNVLKPTVRRIPKSTVTRIPNPTIEDDADGANRSTHILGGSYGDARVSDSDTASETLHNYTQTQERDLQEDVKSTHEGSSSTPENKRNPSQNELPPEITKKLEKELKKQLQDERSEEEKLVEPALEFQFWDFAGQDVYYNSHQVFLNRRAIFLLAFDFSKDLNEAVEVGHVSYNKTAKQVSRFHEFSGLEFIDFWLQSVFTYATPVDESSPPSSADKDAKTGASADVSPGERGGDGGPFYKSPPILIVGTHRNQGHKIRERDARQKLTEEAIKEKQIFDAIKEKPYMKHVVPRMHCIENNPKHRNKDDEKLIDALRQHLCDIALKEPYMGERIPIRWLQFESVLLEHAAKKTHYITLQEAKQLATEHGITDSNEVMTVLRFFHDLGTIIYFGSYEEEDGGHDRSSSLNDLVILDPQWLIDVFKTVITVKPLETNWSTFCDSWELLADKGILADSLIDHIWKKHLHLKDELLAIMEKFDLICPQCPDEEGIVNEKAYYVPACLRPPQSAQDKESVNKTDGTFYLNFQKYLPDAVFNYLTIYAARWSQEISGIPPKLFYRLGRFIVGNKHNRHSCRLEMHPTGPSTPACIKVVVEKKQAYGAAQGNSPASPEICGKIMNFMKHTMKDLQGKWARGIRYELSVACMACKEKRPDSLHLLPLVENQGTEDDDEVYCEFTESPIHMSYYWNQLQNTQSAMTQMTDIEFRTVIKQLSRDDLQNLYVVIGMSHQTVQKAEYKANTTDVNLKAMDVLRQWRQEMQERGEKATKSAILEALEECDNNEAVEALRGIWKLND